MGATDSRWGVSTWGAFLWGDGPDVTGQGTVALAKPDTRLLITGGTYTTDNSQIGASMTSDSGMAYTTGHGYGGGTPFAVEVTFTADNTSVGYLFWIGDDSDATLFGVLVTSGQLRVIYDGTTTSYDLPNVSGTIDEYSAMVSVEDDPLNSGDVLIDVAIVDTDTPGAPDHWTVAQDRDGKAAAATVGKLAVGGNYISGSASGVYDVASTGTLSTLRFSVRPHSSAEFRYDFVDSASPAAVDGELPAQKPRWTDTIGDEGALVGPAWMMAGAHHEARRYTYAGPAWALGINSPPDYDPDASDLGLSGSSAVDPGEDSWIYSPANEAFDFSCPINLIASPPVPSWATHLAVAVKVSSHAGAAASTTTTIGVFCANRNPRESGGGLGFSLSPAIDLEMYSANASWDHDSQDNTGTWLTFDDLRIARGEQGFCWIFIGIYDETSGAEVRIEEVQARFVRKDLDTSQAGGLFAP